MGPKRIEKPAKIMAYSSLALWVLALVLPAYTGIGIWGNSDIIMGGGAFVLGPALGAFVMLGGLPLLLGWSANIVYFIVIAALLKGQYKSRKLLGASLALVILPIGAYMPGGVVFEYVGIGVAVSVWYASIVVCAIVPLRELWRQITT